MAQELVQLKNPIPIIQGTIHSEARGKESMATVLGNIAERSMTKAQDFATEASKTNLLQTNAMLKDVESNSKLEMLKSPGHAIEIAKNAQQTAEQIKSNASLNRLDRINLDLSTKDMVRSLNFSAQEKSIAITNQLAKHATLSAFSNTLQQLEQDIFSNPEQAEKTIEAQYTSLSGQVKSGILTAVEAANLHKQIENTVRRSQLIMQAYSHDDVDASDVNALHIASHGAGPLNNSSLPMKQDTLFHSDNYIHHINTKDMKASWSHGGYVSPYDLSQVKRADVLEGLLAYKNGSAMAGGDIAAGKSWKLLKQTLNGLNGQHSLSTVQTGYRDRLHNFVKLIENGGYDAYVASTPDGARAWNEYNLNNTVNSNYAYTGTKEDVARQRSDASIKNLNTLVTRLNSIGIGADIPDEYRHPVPRQFTAPILDSFNEGADPNIAINNLSQFSEENRAYIANSAGNLRQAQVIYETGQLIGKAEKGFLINYWLSQQNTTTPTGKESLKEPKYIQIEKEEGRLSDKKIVDKINASMNDINSYWGFQSGGPKAVSASTEKALRYVKFMAAKNKDYKLENTDEYINEFVINMSKAYPIESGFNYLMDNNIVPLSETQKTLLAAHAINAVRNKLLKKMNPEQIDEYFSSNPPLVVTNPLGRVQVIDQSGSFFSDGEGHAAFDEIYTSDLWHAAEMDKEAKATAMPPGVARNSFLNRVPLF